jgi:hypothetical protein
MSLRIARSISTVTFPGIEEIRNVRGLLAVSSAWELAGDLLASMAPNVLSAPLEEVANFDVKDPLSCPAGDAGRNVDWLEARWVKAGGRYTVRIVICDCFGLRMFLCSRGGGNESPAYVSGRLCGWALHLKRTCMHGQQSKQSRQLDRYYWWILTTI